MKTQHSLLWMPWLLLAAVAWAAEAPPASRDPSVDDAVMKVVTIANMAGKLTAPASVDEFPPDTLKTCLAVAADYSPVYPTTRFAKHGHVVAVFRLAKAGEAVKLTCTWTAIERNGFAIVRRDLAKSDLTVPKGADRGSFTFSPSNLRVGQYRVEVAADGKPWKSLDFTLIEPPKPDLADPTALFPLTPGLVRGYTMLVHPGPRGFSSPAFAANPGGTFWTRFFEIVEGADADGVHVSHLLMGPTQQRALDEWFLWGPKGLVETKEASFGKTTLMNPPQVRIPMPLRAPTTWSYHSQDGAIRKTFRLWGPLPLRGLKGEAPGYVILEEQSLNDKAMPGGGKQTIERHYIPGEGLVRSIFAVASRSGDWCRIDTVLRDAVTVARMAAAPARGQGPMCVPGTPGIELRVSAWAPPLDSGYGWWGLVKAGDKPDKPLVKSNSEFKLNAPAGFYDVYWVQDYLTRERPLLLASRVEVKEGNLTILPVDSGIQLAVAPWVPPRDADYGRCALVRPGDPLNKWINETRTGDRLLAPAGVYDVYWVQDFETRDRPLLLASKVEVKAGLHAQVPINTGVALNVAPWVPKRDADYGWFSIVPSGGSPDKWLNGTRTGDRLLAPAGVYDIYWVQDYATRDRPLRLASKLEVKAGEKATVNATSGIRLKVPAGTPALHADYGWWGAVPSGARADQWANLVKGKYDVPILLPAGAYDLFCRRDYEDKPHCIAAAIEVPPDRLVEVEANPFNTVPQPAVALVLPGQELLTCLAVAADVSPIYPTREFYSSVHELFAMFRVGQAGAIKNIGCDWRALDAAGKASQVLGTSSLDISSTVTHGYFRYALKNPLSPGRYRVELTADGRPWQSADFTVVDAPRNIALARPEDFLPLRQGVSWSYDFVMQAGPGQHIEIPGVTPDADGKLRATLTVRVNSLGPDGAEVEGLLNGTRMTVDGWRLNADGLLITRTQLEGAEPYAFDPPEPLVSFPLQSFKTWEYASKDGAVKRSYRMWGPVPVAFGGRQSPGYVVLCTAGDDERTRTVERHYLPGTGMVRKITVEAARGTLLTRTEMTLRPTKPGTPLASSQP